MARQRHPKAPWLAPGLTDEQAIMLMAEHQQNSLGRRITEGAGYWPTLLWLIEQGRLTIEGRGIGVSGPYIQYGLPAPTPQGDGGQGGVKDEP
jgi:hypothetical protein